jgi:hypothetical protein
MTRIQIAHPAQDAVYVGIEVQVMYHRHRAVIASMARLGETPQILQVLLIQQSLASLVAHLHPLVLGRRVILDRHGQQPLLALRQHLSYNDKGVQSMVHGVLNIIEKRLQRFRTFDLGRKMSFKGQFSATHYRDRNIV